MKKIYYKISFVISCIFLLPSLGGVGGELYAQSEDLLSDTWDLLNGEINGQTIPVEEHHLAQFESSFSGGDIFDFSFGNCFEFFSVPFVDLTNDEFSLLNITSYTQGNCTDPGDLVFIDLHNSFYFELPLDTNGTPKNPFTYTIEDFGNYRELTIQNPEGDWLLYGGIVLSTPSFPQNSFAILPNPVKEVLKVNNSSNQRVSATIYDINGNLLQTHSLENNLNSMDVTALNPGLYFVVFESENGERVSKKFIKQ